MADKGYTYLHNSKRKNLESFEIEVLSRICSIASIPFSNDFSIFYSFGAFSVYRNSHYTISVLANSGTEFNFDNTAYVLESLSKIDVAPNLVGHGMLDGVFPYIVLQNPKAAVCNEVDERELFIKNSKVVWSEDKKIQIQQAQELRVKFYRQKERNLGRVLATIHDTAKLPKDFVSKFCFLDIPESIQNLYPKLSELIQLCKFEYKKLDNKNLHIVSGMFFNPEMTLTNGFLYMPIEWSSVNYFDLRTELGSVFLSFELSDWSNFYETYAKECGIEIIKSCQILKSDCLKMGAIFNLFQSLHYYSYVNTEKSLSKEAYHKKLRDAMKNIFLYAVNNKGLENKLKTLMKF